MRLLSTNDPRVIAGIIEGLHKETRAMFDQISEICWYMRGGMSREEVLNMSYLERQSVMKLIETNIKRVNDTRLPLL